MSPFGGSRSPWRVLLDAIPGPLVAWVMKWIGIFDQITIIANPSWTDADGNAIAFSVPLVLISLYIGEGRSKRWFSRALLITFSCLGACFVACFLLKLYLDKPPAQPVLDHALGLIWEALYIIFIVSIVLAITFAVLLRSASPANNKPSPGNSAPQ